MIPFLIGVLFGVLAGMFAMACFVMSKWDDNNQSKKNNQNGSK